MDVNAFTPLSTPVSGQIFTKRTLDEKAFMKIPHGSVADKGRGHTDGRGLHISSYAFTSSRAFNKQLCAADKGWSLFLGLVEGLTGPDHKKPACYKTLTSV
jgi:hypothetical protein